MPYAKRNAVVTGDAPLHARTALVTGAVGAKAHILGRAPHYEQRRQHQQSHGEDAEYHPSLTPAER